MGLVKDRIIKEEQRGFRSPPEKYVCKYCFGDYAVREFIEGEALSESCDYCGRRNRKNPIAAPIESVIEFILEGIKTEWGNPSNEGVGWASSEGGWLGVDVIDTYDLLTGDEGLEIENEVLLNDILDSIIEEEWCKINPYALSRDEELVFTWESFCNQVKYRARYMFFRIPRKKSIFKSEKSPAPHEILFTLGEMINELSLIKAVMPGTLYIRARCHGKKDRYTTLEDLGPPRKEETVSNRMSPAGIVMFYGALDANTAIREIRDGNVSKKHVTTVAFRVLKPFKVLDLTDLPPVPSLFDPGRRDKRSAIIFLHSFCSDISKPIEKDGRVHIEYVPTQVVTEYLRLIFGDKNKKPIRGIIYPSSKLKGGKSCVLFFTSDNCKTDNFTEKETDIWLSMQTSSIKTQEFRA